MRRLRAAAVPSHTLAAELLLMHTLGRDRAWLYAHPEQPLQAAELAAYFDLVERRIAGVPTQYLTGRQEFWGLELEVTPDVLIPRPETEHVVEVALERLGPPTWEEEAAGLPRGHGLRIADVGTGSGCLAIALACELPGAQVFATDISAAALAVARRNAGRHGVAGRIHLVQGNLLDALAGPPLRPLDLIVSNPPYVGRREADHLPLEVRAHEPPQALFGGESGQELYAPLIAQAARLLRSGGILVMELGYNALLHVRPLLETGQDWQQIRLTRDLAGIPRVLSAQRV
ncbi:MAG: peptide chain release factor N(5)-glutamine methyltransferase [Firmicutes bacterium]|nr:peptide chain release factor N(5)-glutamine methyltransferase [Bacillota bacterium]